MSDDKDEVDWLSSQFNPTEQVPKQPAAAAPASPAATPAAAPPAVTPPPPAASAPTPPTATPPPAAPPAVTPPQASAPTPNTNGGFNWGLRPGGGQDAAAAATPQTPALPPTPSFVPASAPAPAPAAVTPPPLVVPEAPPALVQPPEPTPTVPFVPHAEEPTQPLSWDEFAATQASTPAPAESALDQPTEAYTVQPWQPSPTAPAASVFPGAAATAAAGSVEGAATEERDPTSAIDSLFGDHQFQAYEEVGVLQAVQTTGTAPTEPRPPREPLTSSQRALMGVAGGLIAVLILIGMFFLGEHLGAASAATPSAAATGGSTTVPNPAGSGGPASPGVQEWSALQGGECIQPFTTAWAVTFTVVACSSDHDAEMVFKGTLPDPADSSYPSTTQFQTELTPLCSASTAINYSAASAVTDLQVSFSYPASTSKWLKGDRTYYCFVDRQSGGNLPGDLAPVKTAN